MAPAAVAIFVISLSVGAFSAPNRCASCQTWESHGGYQTESGSGGWINQDNLSQRSSNLEDLTQQAETELHRSPGQLAFDNTRSGNWTDVNHYRTADGHGRVYEEQGQRVDGPTRIRFYRKNFTSSYNNGNSGALRETDLGGFNSLGREDAGQLISHGTADHSLNSAYDQSVTRGNSYTSQGSQYSRDRANGRIDGYYQNRDNSGRYREDSSALNGQATQQGSTSWDQERGGNWTTANTYRTDGGNGQVYEERGQVVTGPRQVRFYKKNYTSSYTSGGAIPTFDLGVDGRRSFESEVQQLQRELESATRDSHRISQDSMNGGYTQETSGHYRQPGSTVGQSNYRYVVRPDNYRPLDQTTSGINSHGTYQHTTNFENQHVSQTGGSSVDQTEQDTRRNINSGYSTSHFGNSDGYGTQRPQRIYTIVEQSGRTTLPVYSDSQTRQSYYDRLSQSQQAEYRRIYGSEGLSQREVSIGNVNNQQQSHYTGSHGTARPSGQMQHYEQFQTSSSSSVRHPDIDVRTAQSGMDQEIQRLHNAHANFGQASSNGYGSSTYRVQNGQLMTQGLDLGQVADTVDCADGTSGHSTFEQTQYHRVYRGVHQPEDLTQQTEDLTQQTEDLTQQTEDLTQQTEDLTQQTQHFGQQSPWRTGKLEAESQRVHDLTQQTEDLTQQTEDLTQQTEDLTQQTQHFGQQTPWRTGKLEVGTQRVHHLTQQTEDLTQQTEDLTQQTQDLTQQTEDLTQQTQHFGQQAPWRPGKLEVESQRVHDLTQQTEDLTQQTEDLTQQTQDLTQQTEDLTQQTQHFGQQAPWRPGKLEVESQRVPDLTQQTEDLTQQTEDLTQQTQHFGQQSPWRSGKLETESQRVHDLTQQTEDLTQQTEDLTQHTQHFGQQSPWRSGKLETESQRVHDLTQQTEDLTQQTEDLTQQTEDLTQQTQHFTQQIEGLAQRDQDFGQQSSWRPGKLEAQTQRVEDLTYQVGQTDDYYLQKRDGDRDFGQESSRGPSRLEVGNQQVEDLTQQTEDLTQQTEDLTQQTQHLTQHVGQTDDYYLQKPVGDHDFGQESYRKPGKLEVGSQQIADLTQQTEDITQHVGQESSWKPGKLEVGGQQVEDRTQQTEYLTQQIEDLTQQSEDLTQQTEHLGQQSSWQPGQLEFGSQRVEDLTQQTENLGQQTEDLGQQTQDLGQLTEDHGQQTQDLGQLTEDLGQQTEDLSQQSSWQPGQLEIASQRVEDLTQQTENLGQRTEDLGQQTQDLGQLTEDLGQQTQDLGQLTEDLGQQTEDLGQQSSWQPGQLEFGSQRVEDLTQQTENLGQQTEDLGQQTQDLGQLTEDLGQQTQDLGQLTEDLGQQTEDLGQQSSWQPGQLEFGSQRVEDLTQQTENLGQQTEDLGQQTQDLGQLTEDLGQQTEDLGQQSSWQPGQLEFGSQRVEDLTQQTENLGQQTEDLGQQTQDLGQLTEDLGQQTQDLGQLTEDLGQQTEDLGHQSSWRPGQLEIGSQRVEDLTQQTENLGQQTEDLGQQTQDLGQLTEDFGQQTGGLPQQTEDIWQLSGKIDHYIGQTTGNSAFGQESSWKSPEQGIISQRAENLDQGNQFGTHQTPIYPGQVSTIAPKPVPRPKRPRPANFHPTQQINVELEESTTDSHSTIIIDQQDHKKWEVTGNTDPSTTIPHTPHRGDQGIDPNSDEPEQTEVQIETITHKVLEQQSGYVPVHPSSFNHETTTEEQVRKVQPTKTKTGRRTYQGGQRLPKVNDWYPTRDVVYSQQPTTRLVDGRPSGLGSPVNSNLEQSTSSGQFTEGIQQHWTNTEETQQVESSQTFQRIQHVGSSIENRQQSSVQPNEEVRIQPRILEAYGASGPYDINNYDLLPTPKPFPDTALTPPDGRDAWDIRVVDRRVTTTTEASVPTSTIPITTTTTTTTTTPIPPPTPAPSFWRRIGNSVTNTYDKAKEKAKELFG